MSKKPVEFSAMLVDAVHHEFPEDTLSSASPNLLAVRLAEGKRVRVKTGRVVAGAGRIAYTPPGKLATDDGLDASGGGVLGGYEGEGRLLVADSGKEITIVRMRSDESFGVAANALLAVEDRATVDVVPAAASFGGAWQALIVTGPARIALVAHGAIRPFAVTPDSPVFVKPGFVVGWTIGMSVELKGGKQADARLSFSGTGQVFLAGASDEEWHRE